MSVIHRKGDNLKGTMGRYKDFHLAYNILWERYPIWSLTQKDGLQIRVVDKMLCETRVGLQRRVQAATGVRWWRKLKHHWLKLAAPNFVGGLGLVILVFWHDFQGNLFNPMNSQFVYWLNDV